MHWLDNKVFVKIIKVFKSQNFEPRSTFTPARLKFCKCWVANSQCLVEDKNKWTGVLNEITDLACACRPNAARSIAGHKKRTQHINYAHVSTHDILRYSGAAYRMLLRYHLHFVYCLTFHNSALYIIWLYEYIYICIYIYIYIYIYISMCSGSLSPRHGASSGCG